MMRITICNDQNRSCSVFNDTTLIDRGNTYSGTAIICLWLHNFLQIWFCTMSYCGFESKNMSQIAYHSIINMELFIKWNEWYTHMAMVDKLQLQSLEANNWEYLDIIPNLVIDQVILPGHMTWWWPGHSTFDVVLLLTWSFDVVLLFIFIVFYLYFNCTKSRNCRAGSHICPPHFVLLFETQAKIVSLLSFC